MEVESGDASQLRLVMGCMRDIRNRTDKTDASFEPLRKTVQLLKKYGIMLSELTLKKLEEAPMAWAALKKKMFQKREKMGAQQQAEAGKIRQDSETFRVKVDNFRALFKKKAPFGVSTRAGPAKPGNVHLNPLRLYGP